MATLATLGLVGILASGVDPMNLPLGQLKGTVEVPAGSLVDTRSGQTVTALDVAKASEGHRFVYLGESHTNKDHHKMQAAIIEALARRNRDVIVGFEMFTRPRQVDLNAWTLGWQDEAEFIDKSGWKTEWGFDFALYKPIFDAVKRLRLPMIALNVPRDWVRTVGRQGLQALQPQQRDQLPKDIDLGWKDHRQFFEAMVGGHPMAGTMGDNMYAAQVLWDVGMADSALKYWQRTPRNSKTVIVILAGVGHIAYGLGINGRIAKMTGENGVTVSMVESADTAIVSRGLGDFVYAARPSATEK